METTGDTASLKRKRKEKDNSQLAQTNHRRRSRSKVQVGAGSEPTVSVGGGHIPENLFLQQAGGGFELRDASSQLPAGPGRERLASWKVSKSMGGRMMDIDPVF